MINIRPAQDTDCRAVFMLAQSFATSFVVEEEAFRRSFSKLLTSPDTYLAVAESHEGVAGYVLGFDHYALYANGRVAWVEEIMVAESVRRQGIGEQLMQAFEAWAVTREVKLIALATRRAAAFYLALGYEESATYFRKKL